MTSLLNQTDQSRLSLKYGVAVLRLWLDEKYAHRNEALNDLGHKFQAALLRYDNALDKAEAEKAALKKYKTMRPAEQLKHDRPDFVRQVALADLAAQKLFKIGDEILSDQYADQPFNFTMVRKILLEIQSVYDDVLPESQSSAGARVHVKQPVSNQYPGKQILGSFLQSYIDEHGWKLTPQQFVMQQLEIEDFPNENPLEFYEDYWDSGIIGTKMEGEFKQWFKEQKKEKQAETASATTSDQWWNAPRRRQAIDARAVTSLDELVDLINANYSPTILLRMSDDQRDIILSLWRALQTGLQICGERHTGRTFTSTGTSDGELLVTVTTAPVPGQSQTAASAIADHDDEANWSIHRYRLERLAIDARSVRSIEYLAELISPLLTNVRSMIYIRFSENQHRFASQFGGAMRSGEIRINDQLMSCMLTMGGDLPDSDILMNVYTLQSALDDEAASAARSNEHEPQEEDEEEEQVEPAGKAVVAAKKKTASKTDAPQKGAGKPVKIKQKKKTKRQKAAEEVKKIRDEQRQLAILEENKADIERLRLQLAATNLRQSETGAQLVAKELSPFGPILSRIDSYKKDTRSKITVTGAAASAESFQRKLLASLHVV